MTATESSRRGEEATEHRVRLVLITGLSGSGKSTVAKCFEDLGFYCIDNLPVPLLRDFLRRPTEQVPGVARIAVVSDVRAPGLVPELPGLIRDIDRDRVRPTILFLDTSDEVLVRRFSETRRRHPLAEEDTVIEGIRRERELLAELRGMADLVLDTSEWTVHDIRAAVFREFGGPELHHGPILSLVSFGFKKGIPYGANLLFDVRYLPNPHFVPELEPLTGRDRGVQDYLDQHPDFGDLVDRLDDFLRYLLPLFRAENRSYLTVAVGCTGGRHRSVAVVERLADRLRGAGWTTHVVHRDSSTDETVRT